MIKIRLCMTTVDGSYIVQTHNKSCGTIKTGSMVTHAHIRALGLHLDGIGSGNDLVTCFNRFVLDRSNGRIDKNFYNQRPS